METFATSIISTISSTSVDFITDFVTAYWGVILSIGAVLLMAGYFMRLTRMGRAR